jgi:hypothetical protein
MQEGAHLCFATGDHGAHPIKKRNKLVTALQYSLKLKYHALLIYTELGAN